MTISRIFIYVDIVIYVVIHYVDIVIYVARWWEKYLSKCSPVKHTCSWRDKLIILYIVFTLFLVFILIIFLLDLKATHVLNSLSSQNQRVGMFRALKKKNRSETFKTHTLRGKPYLFIICSLNKEFFHN